MFIVLTALVLPFCILAAWDYYDIRRLLINLVLIELLLVLTFSVLDLFLFCIFFESLLLPMFFIILWWGSRERRIKALTYFVLYTLLGSVFLVVSLFLVYFETGSTSYYILLAWYPEQSTAVLLWALLFVVFAIKIPIFPFHIWLPEAHVEAPTVGSVLLAGLLLKIGGYGIIRFLFVLPFAQEYFQPVAVSLCLLSVWLASLMAIRQIDLKRIIAYSSIAHMNFALLGIFSNTLWGLLGGMLLMFSHGVVSSALFLLVGVLYDRYHTRLVHHYGGLVQVMPLFVVYLFIFILSNFSFPGTSNFVGELLIFIGLAETIHKITLLCAGLSTFLTVVYSLFLFNRISFGALKVQYIQLFTDMSRREFYLLTPLFIINGLLGFFPNILILTIYPSMQRSLHFIEFFNEEFVYDTAVAAFGQAEPLDALECLEVFTVKALTKIDLEMLVNFANILPEFGERMQLYAISQQEILQLYGPKAPLEVWTKCQRRKLWHLIDEGNLVLAGLGPDLDAALQGLESVQSYAVDSNQNFYEVTQALLRGEFGVMRDDLNNRRFDSYLLEFLRLEFVQKESEIVVNYQTGEAYLANPSSLFC